MQRQGYKNGGLEQGKLELRTLFSHHLLHVFSTSSYAYPWTICSSDSSIASTIVIFSASPNAARHSSSVPLLHFLPPYCDPQNQCSPLVTILAPTKHAIHSLQGPDRTLPSFPYPSRQRNRMSSPTTSNGSASTVSSTGQSQYQDRLISM